MKQTSTSADKPAAAALQLPAYDVEVWPVDRPMAYEGNARKHSQKQIDQLRDSFRKFGQVWPILVREDETVIAGHGRLEAAKQEGLKEVRVIVARGWSEHQCRAFGILDNKVALNSEWDEALLGQELSALGDIGIDLSSLGFEPQELAKFVAHGTEGNTDPDDAPEEPAAPVCKRGDLWRLGGHRLLCGDSTAPADVKRALAGASPHLMVTDPPYGVKYDPAWRKKAGVASKGAATGKVLNDDRADWREAWALFPGAVAYVWHGGLHATEVAESLVAEKFDLRAQIVWVKTRAAISRGHYHWQHEPCFYGVREGEEDRWRFIPEHEVAAYAVKEGETATWQGSRRESTVWFIEHIRSETGHGTQKPVECMKRPIENNSAPGDSVYEPFSGSGTTIIACEITGRVCRAIELNPGYVDVAVRRWEAFAGEKATLDGDGRTFEEVAAARAAEAKDAA
ncbi:MAG: DNA modification methylase [Rhizobiaceae bacterium]